MFAELLRSKLLGICEVSDRQAEQLHQHYNLLTRWNRTINLTRVRELDQAVERHYCESIFAACYLPFEPITLADLGSGAGFPGIPIAVMRPDIPVVLIESHLRKTAFLKEAARCLPNVRVIAGRAEDVRGEFDWVVSRAVRYTDMASTLTRLARHVELLTGRVDPHDMPGFIWAPPIQIPWGEHNQLLLGSRST